MSKRKKQNGNLFERAAAKITKLSGSSGTFIGASSMIILWVISGPIFGFSDTWQLVINTSTTIITFLMVFLIQRTQNKDSLAIQLKLNELVAAVEGANNRIVDIEDLSEKELETLHRHYERLAELAKKESKLSTSHSVEEAEKKHLKKVESSAKK